MAKEIIHSDNAPAAIGPYSQAVKSGSTVYLAGQIPLDPSTMEVVAGDISAQAVQVFKNLTAVCNAAGGNLSDAVKLNIFLADLQDFAEVNAVMADFLAEPYPARACVEVSALPRGVQVEIDGILEIE
ncbi:MAG: reactive intermediate/imine deaminase [Gammaproteobacteria bacterium]|jgi:reactive intermediate/imine deaminase